MSREATARLFVAVDPPPAVCGELAAWAREALGGRGARGHVRLLGAETMHVTLCFVGARAAGEIDAIAHAVERCAAREHLSLRSGAPLWLPPRRPRSLALEVGDAGGELARVHESVQAALADAIDWQPERRRFRAHVTVARLGRGAGELGRSSGGGGGGGELLPPSPQLSFGARELVLYRSLLSPQGASYEALATRELPASSDEASAPSSSPSSPAGEGEGERFEPTGTRQASIDPSSAARGAEPSSHSGSPPSAHS